jgi:uncharacterized heparinase superfamily protein
VIRDRVSDRPFHVVLDHGPLGYLSIAAHGHADANAILLSVDGMPVFVDPGTYLYHSGGAWRDWFRGTRAHNSLTVGGADQSTIAGPFNWTRHAAATLIDVHNGVDWSVRARHDGYLRTSGVVHERRVFAAPDGFVIQDTLDPAEKSADVEVVFQLAPDLQATPVSGGYRISRDGDPILDLTFDALGDVTAAAGGDLGQGGWVSPRFGEKCGAVRIAWAGSLPSAGLSTRIIILPHLKR